MTKKNPLNLKRIEKAIFALFVISLINTNIHAQNNLFATDDLLELSIKMDIKGVAKDVAEKREYHKAVLSYKNNGSEKEVPILIKTRGHFRRQRTVCKFPPLRIKFAKEDVQGTLFEGQKKLKLVTHCGKNDTYERNLLKEYLIYKMYNIITDQSYKARLVRVKYIDTKGKVEEMTKYSFFIEDTQHMAERIGGKILNARNVHDDKTDFDKMTILAVFQFMIANTDWSVATLHNIRLVTVDPWQPPIAVAYDFDWAGFVNAPYAKPAKHLPIEDVTERIFRGYYRTPEQLNQAFEVFRNAKGEIMHLLTNFPFLDEKYTKKNIRFIEEFYDIINNPKSVKREFIENCRSMAVK